MEKLLEGKELAKTPSPRVLSEINELQAALKLAKPPLRIECFDISNISGTNAVGSMVTFYGGVPIKDDYRKFKIRGLKGKPDDVAAMYEVVKRRYGGALSRELPLPDLAMVDGGITQVNAASKGLIESGQKDLPVIGLAKQEEKIYRLGGGKPLALPRSSAALKLLQRLRDEAHRFAISYHRYRRKKALYR